jgi:DNA-binding transcriptional regulator YiaG
MTAYKKSSIGTDALGPFTLTKKSVGAALVIVSGLGMPGTSSANALSIYAQQFSGSNNLGIYVRPRRNEQQEPSITTASAITEIKRLSGLTWAELSLIFDVSPKALHNWSNGSQLSAPNEANLRRALSSMRYIDRKDDAVTRQAIYSPLENGTTAFDLLVENRFEDFRLSVGEGPSLPALPALSIEAINAKAPIDPVSLIDTALEVSPTLIKSTKPFKKLPNKKKDG